MVAKKGEDPSKGQRVTEMAIGYPPNIGDDAQGVIILPLGIVVDEDIVIEVDAKKALSFPVRYCDSGGCAALFKLDKGDIEKFRKGTEIMVKTKAFTGQPVTIALSLKNFVSVMDEIKPKK
jgi:invasion protein IalB